jgi:hypothetical protein
MGGNVDAPRAGESLKAMRDGVESLRQGVNFDVDFVRARRKLIEDMLGQSTVSGSMVQQLGEIEQFKLPPDYYDQLLKHIAAVSPAQVKLLITKELDPKNEIVVCLADRATLVRAFEEAGLEQVKIVEPDYRCAAPAGPPAPAGDSAAATARQRWARRVAMASVRASAGNRAASARGGGGAHQGLARSTGG